MKLQNDEMKLQREAERQAAKSKLLQLAAKEERVKALQKKLSEIQQPPETNDKPLAGRRVTARKSVDVKHNPLPVTVDKPS